MKNRKGHLHGSSESENGLWRNVEDEVCGSCMNKKPNSRGLITLPLIIYKTTIMSCRIKKMPLWALNFGPFTLMMWK